MQHYIVEFTFYKKRKLQTISFDAKDAVNAMLLAQNYFNARDIDVSIKFAYAI